MEVQTRKTLGLQAEREEAACWYREEGAGSGERNFLQGVKLHSSV
jgi:hypothetical protein